MLDVRRRQRAIFIEAMANETAKTTVGGIGTLVFLATIITFLWVIGG